MKKNVHAIQGEQWVMQLIFLRSSNQINTTLVWFIDGQMMYAY
jgi:hypothetical protein